MCGGIARDVDFAISIFIRRKGVDELNRVVPYHLHHDAAIPDAGMFL